MAMTFSIAALLKLTPIVNGTPATASALTLTDHNRSPLQISTEVIEQSNRMANGTMRKYVVAAKSSFSTDWNDLPSSSSYTVDGKAGADSMSDFYSRFYQYPIKLDVFYPSSSSTYNVYFKQFNANVTKRSTIYNFYNINAAWEEI